MLLFKCLHFKSHSLYLSTAYQTEIDSLTRRCKNSESAFLNVYKVLAEAPDPYPLLDLAVDQTVKISQVSSLESEVARLRQENDTLHSKVEGQGSNDRERRKAERKVEILEEKMEELVREHVLAKENELKAIYEERLLNYEERCTIVYKLSIILTVRQGEGLPTPSYHDQITVERIAKRER